MRAWAGPANAPGGQAAQVNARPVGSSAAGTSEQATPGAHGEALSACEGDTAQPSESTHGEAPVPL